MKLKTKKYYKNLYEVELDNRKMLITQNSNLSKDNVKYQKEAKMYKERCARLTVDLEDVDYQLEKATRELEVIKKEKANLKRENTKLKKLNVNLDVTIDGERVAKELNKDGK